MARKLATFVWVDEKWYGPDDSVPAAVAKKITNESAWAEGDGSEPESDPEVPSTPKAPAKGN